MIEIRKNEKIITISRNKIRGNPLFHCILVKIDITLKYQEPFYFVHEVRLGSLFLSIKINVTIKFSCHRKEDFFMLEFEVIEIIKPNIEVIKIIKKYSYTIKNGRIKIIKLTNLKIVEPTLYIITSPTTLTILEYKINEINNKPFYIKEYKEKYNLLELEKLLNKINKSHWLW